MWYPLCSSWEKKDGKYKLILDGAVIAQGADFKKGATIQQKGLFIIGKCPQNSNGCFPAFRGKISSVTMWKTVLGVRFISKIAQQSKCEIKMGDIFSWPMFHSGGGNIEFVSAYTRCKTPGGCPLVLEYAHIIKSKSNYGPIIFMIIMFYEVWSLKIA